MNLFKITSRCAGAGLDILDVLHPCKDLANMVEPLGNSHTVAINLR